MNDIITKKIFGKNVVININDKVMNNIIEDRFRLYPEFKGKEDIIININKNKINNKSVLSNNPRTHSSFEKGFKANFGNVDIIWKINNIIDINISVNDANRNILINMKNNFLSMEYNSSDKKKIDQIIYELVLIPTIYFFNNYALIHSSGFVYKNKSFLLGGTGGVGKTSASIAIAKTKKASFLNDDISIIDSNGFIYPNFAYPKIYAYNTINDKELEKKLLLNKSILNKLHWNIKKRRNIKNVRRKIDPYDLYGSVEVDKKKLDYYIILFRESVDEMKLKDVTLEKATSITISVLLSEYGIFNNHIYWNEFNRKMEDKDCIIDMKSVVNNWEKVLNKALINKKIMKLSIPLNISHDKYKYKLLKILDTLIDK